MRSLEPYGNTYVVGDLHGCVAELEALLDALSPTVEDTICFLGDYIDRGPFPRGVIDRLIRLRHEGPRCIFLKGNHEDMFLSYLGLAGQYGESFLMNGGGATLADYGLEALSASDSATRIPRSHLEFLQGLQLQARFGEFLCVHAGLNPSRPLERQADDDLLWIRGEFVNQPHPFGLTVLFGHTPFRNVLVDLPYKVGLDTGLVYGNKLSCLELKSKQLLQIGRGSRHVLRSDLSASFDAARAVLP